jgi:hypothetical protein
LRGEILDLDLVAGALVRIDSADPVRVSMLAGPGPGRELASADMAPPGGLARLERRGDAGVSRSPVLRLHLETAPGSRVVLHNVVLVPQPGLRPEACGELVDCAAKVPVLAARQFVLPEAMLSWRDDVLRERPAAIVRPRADGKGRFAASARAALQRPWATWLLALTPVFVGLVSRTRGREPSRGVALLELALVFAPWLLLQGIALPDDAAAPLSWMLAGGLVGALLLRPFSPSTLAGDASAWRAALKFAVGAAGVIALLAAVNAADADGFAPRAVSATKAWQYPLWALLQQTILLRAIAPRMGLATGSPSLGALASGAVFGAQHLPNFALMVATFVAGTAWSEIGRRHPALLPLATVHAACGIALVWAAPGWLLRSAEIGARYLMGP